VTVSLITRASALLLIALSVCAVLIGVLGRARGSAAGGVDAAVFDSPHIVFRSLEPGADKGRVAYVPADDSRAPRRLAPPRCLRVAAAAHQAVCLRAPLSPTRPYEVVALDDRLREGRDEPLSGVPSRARVAPDGRHFATTVFVNGHNYISLGFSTETMIYDGDGKALADLEDFAFMLNGARNENVDRNIWGVTFAADSNSFFATVATGGRTYLARGDVERRTLTAIKENAECPSLSPDQRTVVYKKRLSPSVEQAWRFTALNLETGVETPLGERRSVDDQVAWLDDRHVLYGAPGVAGGRATSDIWVAPIDGGRPRLLLRNADSPTVVGDEVSRD
jgi:hypothetical protein